MANAGDVFAVIKDRREFTRAEIARLSGLSRGSVASGVSALLASGLVVESEHAPSTGGRPATRVSLHAHAGVVFSVAIGISRTRVAVCDLAGEILRISDIDQEVALGPDDLMPDVIKRLDDLLYDRPEVRVFGVGLSLPGGVDRDRICSRESPILPGWDSVPLSPYFAELDKLSDAPVVIDRDANAIAVAERSGRGRNYNDVLVLKASTGLGAGIIAGGMLQRGATQAAGEFGHNKAAAARGLPCRCGDTGCLEAVAAGWAIVHSLQQQGVAVRHLRDVVHLANEGDPEARRLIRESGRHIGEVVATAVNLLNPALLVVAGDMAGAHDIFVAGLRETLYGNATTHATSALAVEPAHHGDRSATIGTAEIVANEVLTPRAIEALLRKER